MASEADTFLRSMVDGARVAPSGTPITRTTPIGGKNEALTGEQSSHLAAEQCLRQGMSRERINSSLLAAGYRPLPDPEGGATAPTPSAPTTPQAPATPQTPEQIEAAEEAAAADAFELPAATSAAEYKLPSLAHASEGILPAGELAARAEASAGWLLAGQFPAASGSSLSSTIQQVSQQWLAQTPAEQDMRASSSRWQSWEKSQMAMLRNLWKGDTFDTKVAAAKGLVDRLEQARPGLKHLLNASGAGSSAAVVVALARQAEKLARRSR